MDSAGPSFIVNELTLPRLAWRVLSGRAATVLVVDPLLPPLRPLLERAVRLLEKRGARQAIDLFPEDRDTWNFPNRIFSEDVLAITEPWQKRAYRFDQADSDPRHGYALKQLSTIFLFRRYVATHVLAKMAAQEPELRIHGLSPAFAGLAQAWRGPGALGPARVQRVPVRMLNLVSALIGLAAAAAFTLSRLRPSFRTHEVFVLADHDALPADLPLFAALKDGGEVALALRRAEAETRLHPDARALRRYLPKDGLFTPRGALATIAEACRDALDLLRRYGRWMEPALFYQMALLPYRRAVIRALLNRVRPQIFWARDDYNVEHILRRQELRRIGARQFGLNHAVQGICILLPQTRYVSMDVYFTMGSAFHPHFKDSWPADMALRPIGGFHFTAEYFSRPRRRSRAILFMARFVTGTEEFVRTVRLAAQAFPDRPIWVQTKKNYPSEAVRRLFVDRCLEGLPNVAERDDPVYDLILEPDIVVSDPSTIIAEAIQLKIPTLVLDVIEGQRSSIFREFPGLCVSGAEECVTRLQELVGGDEVFDPHRYARLIDLAERPFTDIVRKELGLAVHGVNTVVDATPPGR